MIKTPNSNLLKCKKCGTEFSNVDKIYDHVCEGGKDCGT